MARGNQKAQLGKIRAIVIGVMSLCACSCALGPVESDPDKANERFAKMAQDCYKRGGTWNDNVKTCVGADIGKNF